MVEGKNKQESGLDLLILQRDSLIVTPGKWKIEWGTRPVLEIKQMRREGNVTERICTHQSMLRVFRRDLKDSMEWKE